MWDWAVWGALIASALAGSGALALLGVRGLRAWRTLKDVRGNLTGSLGELGAKGEATAEKAASAGDTAELQASVARLRVSLARLAVLREALDEAEDSVSRVKAVVRRG